MLIFLLLGLYNERELSKGGSRKVYLFNSISIITMSVDLGNMKFYIHIQAVFENVLIYLLSIDVCIKLTISTKHPEYKTSIGMFTYQQIWRL